MVGVVMPNGTTSPAEDRSSENREKTILELNVQNPIQLRSSVTGAYSNTADEHCVTWISQTSLGRTLHEDPLCRAVCIRRVFAHEVRRLTPHFSHDAAFHARVQLAAAKQQRAEGSSVRYPLPVEGQPRMREDDDYDESGWRSIGAPRANGGMTGGVNDVRYWEEGWYIWMAKGRLAIQDHIDLMAFNIPEQTRRLEAKEKEADSASVEASSSKITENSTDAQTWDGHAALEVPDAEKARTFYYPAEESLLVRIPTSFPVSEWTQKALAPTWSVLSTLQNSFESGKQQRLARHTWGLVREGTPFVLVRNVLKTWRDSFRGGRESN